MTKEMWLVYDPEGLYRNRDYVRMYEDICLPYKIRVRAVLSSEVREQIMNGFRPVFVLVRTICPSINAFFEQMKIPVFNSSKVSEICNDKGRTLAYVQDTALSVPSVSLSSEKMEDVIRMSVSEMRKFFLERFVFSGHKKQEEQIIREAQDYVIKSIDGHGGKQVFSMTADKAKIREGIGDSSVVLQPMICCGKESRDMRVYVVGTEIVAAVMRSSTVDFRANFSRGGDVRLYKMTKAQEKVVRRILGRFSFGMAGIDFIVDAEGTMIFNEIEDVVGARMLYQCAPEINIAQKYVEYILEQISYMERK